MYKKGIDIYALLIEFVADFFSSLYMLLCYKEV